MENSIHKMLFLTQFDLLVIYRQSKTFATDSPIQRSVVKLSSV